MDFGKLGGWGLMQGSHFVVRDSHLGQKTHGSMSGKYSAAVGAHDTALLVVTEVPMCLG